MDLIDHFVQITKVTNFFGYFCVAIVDLLSKEIGLLRMATSKLWQHKPIPRKLSTKSHNHYYGLMLFEKLFRLWIVLYFLINEVTFKRRKLAAITVGV